MRRLAAILAADVVGYSALMGADQQGTLAALRQLRAELFGPAVAEHRGKIVKSMGDGWLVEFASAIDAVSCAMQVQDRLAGHETIRLRIGIDLGDITHEDEDVFGDGVNVAARLEGIAEPGAVVVSDAVHGNLDLAGRARFADGGERRLKNIDRPVRVWHLRPAAAPPARPISAERPSIAVLVFANLSDDPSKGHVAEGISEDIIDALARCRWLVVMSRNASFAYRGQSRDVREIARELGVRYILDGSVRTGGTRMRIMAQLIDGRSGARLWGARYDRDGGDVFALQDEIAETIAGTIEPELSAIEGAALADRAPGEMTAWECFQRGLWHLYRFTADELEMAKGFFERAIALDAGLAPAHARLAYVHFQLTFYGPYEERGAQLARTIELARAALRLDDREPTARVALGRALALLGQSERAIEELRAAVALDPSFAQAHFALAQALTFAERADEALAEIGEAMRLSPHDPHLWTFLHVRALARYIAGDLDRAAEDERAALRQPHVTFWPALVQVAILGRAGRTAEAAEAIAELDRFRPGMTCADGCRECMVDGRPWMPAPFMDRFRADLRAGGLPEGEA